MGGKIDEKKERFQVKAKQDKKRKQKIYDKQGFLLPAEVTRRASKYFAERPTLLKPYDPDEYPDDKKSKSEVTAETKKDHYPIKNPYFEDKLSYDIHHCMN